MFVNLCRSLLLFVVLASVSPLKAEQEDFVLNLSDADISVFIKTVSEITGKNFVIDPRVQGKITVITATPASADRIYEIFLSALNVNGFVAVESGDIIKIVPDIGAMQRATGDGQGAGGDQLVTRVIEVEQVEVGQLAGILKPLLPASAYMAAHPDARVIVVADTADNVERVARIVRRIDRGSDQAVDVVPLTHIDAEQLIETIESLQQGGLKKGRTSGANLAVLVPHSHSNSILVSGLASERTELRELIARLDVPADTLRAAQVVYLKHAVAADLQKVLQGIGEKLKAPQADASRFQIEADEGANALIMSAPADLMLEVRSLISKLDVPRSQVQVEGVIAEISTNRGAELGIEWQSALTGDGLFGILRTPIAGSSASSIPGGTTSTDGFPGSVGGGLSLGYFSNGDLRGLLTALASDSSTKILSTPTVVTLDNQKALIHVGQNVPIVTGSFTNDSGADDPFQTIERRDVGIKLEVTPQINEGNTVRMEIRQEVSSVDPGSDATGLITNERTIETTVQVDDGQIIALGGLISDDITEQESSVPYVGEIPLVGELFTSRRSAMERRNLVVFLRPTILGRGEKQQVMMESRYRQMRRMQLGGRHQGAAVSNMPGQRAAILPAYPPAADKPVIALPESAPPEPEGQAATDDYMTQEYSFFDFE